MNDELKKAAEEVLSDSSQSQEFKRRLIKLLQNVATSNYSDSDVLQVIELAEVAEEE